jgi:rod shape-determining protein MreC
MAGISNIKRVRAIIREKTSNNKVITIFTFLFVFFILFSSFVFPILNYSLKVKVLDYSSNLISALYSPIKTINNSIDNFYKILNVYNINKELVLENEKNKNISNELITLKAENKEYKKLLNITEDINFKFVTAKIISRSTLSFSKSVIVMAGVNNKVSLNNPVIFNTSLVGYVSEVGNNSSRIKIITDSNIKIPAIILEKNIKIILTGNNSKYLEILNYDELLPIKPGDKVFTSGDGNKFPEKLFVGTVRSKVNGGLIIEPSIAINNLNYVSILDWNIKDRGIDIKVDPIFYD